MVLSNLIKEYDEEVKTNAEAIQKSLDEKAKEAEVVEPEVEVIAGLS